MTAFHHVPHWVFIVFAVLVAVGVTQSFPRQVALRRTVVLPIVLLGLSLAGVVTTFGSVVWALPAWVAGVAAALIGLQGRIDVSAVQYAARKQRFSVPGSWAPLALMMGLFAVKFGAGMALALQPSLARSVPLALVASAAYGLFSGAFVARSMALWSVARQAMQPVPA
ncbi:MAG: DUF6622 family protein [Burkholderiales bacterium]